MINCVCKMTDQKMYYKKTRELELITGCQICSDVLSIDSLPCRFDTLILVVFELFQNLKLVIYASYFMT